MPPKKFINFTNHPSFAWSEKQTAEAEKYGEIEDYPFPAVPATYDEEEVWQLAQKCATEIMRKGPAAVLCQGEYSLAFAAAFLLRQKSVKVLAACSERCVNETEENGITRRESIFQFVRFREF